MAESIIFGGLLRDNFILKNPIRQNIYTTKSNKLTPPVVSFAFKENLNN